MAPGAGGSRVGRLFVEIAGDTNPLRKSLDESVSLAKQAGLKVQNAGRSLLVAFDSALNPTIRLREQVMLLQAAGKSSSDIWKVYGDRMKAGADAARLNGQAIDPLIKKQIELNDTAKKGIFHFDSLGKTFSGVRGAMLGMGIALGTAEIVRGIMRVGGESIKMGMDAVESENLFSVSMGKMANSAAEWSRSLGKSLGLNQYELRKNIGTFNVMFESMKVGSDKAFEMSKSLTQLAYDMASFYNLKPEEAFEKLRAGITGETEPLKRLGILVDETTTKTYAYAHGIAQQGKELTQQQKLLARYASIIEQTSKAQGDLARTMDSPANQLRVLQSRTEELMTTLGMAFLPTMSSITGQLNGAVTSADGLNASLQSLAKTIAFPMAAFLGLKKIIYDVRLASYDASIAFRKAIPMYPKGDIEQLKKERLEVLAGAINVSNEIQTLKDNIASIGKFNYDAAKSATALDAASMGLGKTFSSTGNSAKSFREDLQGVLTVTANLEDNIASTKSALDLFSESFWQYQKDNEEWRKTNALEIPKVDSSDIEMPGMDFGFDKSMKDVSESMGAYRQNLEQTRNSFRDLFFPDQQSAQLAAYQDYYAQLDQLRAENFISEEEYSTARKNLIQQENAVKLSYYQNFFGSLASMQSSNIRALAAIGKAAAITQATINTYEGATKALAQGGIWGSIKMAAVMATGFAQVAAIAAQGFAKGGLVPGGEQLIRVNENGPETVMNAKATREYGPLLQILNSPAPINNRLESSPIARAISRPSVNVSIANYGTSKQFDVQQIDENNIRIIARDEAMGTLRRMGPEVIANDMAYANSRTSKAIARHTTARRADR